MLLPGKTDAFHILRRRLECVPNFIDKFTSIDKRIAKYDWIFNAKLVFQIFSFRLSINSNGNEPINDSRKNVNFDELQQYYLVVQNKHKDSKKQRYRYAPPSDGLS